MRSFLCALVIGLFGTFGWAFSTLSNLPKPPAHLEAKLASASAILIANLPLIANAVAEEEYEYGAVVSVRLEEKKRDQRRWHRLLSPQSRTFSHKNWICCFVM
jgi:hypothetical protein